MNHNTQGLNFEVKYLMLQANKLKLGPRDKVPENYQGAWFSNQGL